uniref:Secreted protein n=1 Tax=Macrostomum lignano TaxID=282301 RepID=A0A1I8FPN9_9PLAT
NRSRRGALLLRPQLCQPDRTMFVLYPPRHSPSVGRFSLSSPILFSPRRRLRRLSPTRQKLSLSALVGGCPALGVCRCVTTPNGTPGTVGRARLRLAESAASSNELQLFDAAAAESGCSVTLECCCGHRTTSSGQFGDFPCSISLANCCRVSKRSAGLLPNASRLTTGALRRSVSLWWSSGLRERQYLCF